MQADRNLKTGQLMPPLRARLGFADPGENLTAFIGTSTPVRFTLKSRGTGAVTIVDDQEAVVVATGEGWVEVEYEWQEGDTDLPGIFYGEFTFTVDAKPLPAPTNNWITVRIISTL